MLQKKKKGKTHLKDLARGGEEKWPMSQSLLVRKIPKISAGAYGYSFQMPVSVVEGLIFGWAYLRWEICVSKSIGLAYPHFLLVSLIVGIKFTIFALFYFVFEGNFPSSNSLGAYI